MSCSPGVDQELIEAIVKKVIYEEVSEHRVQAALQSCANGFLGQNARVVTCDVLDDLVCAVAQQHPECFNTQDKPVTVTFNSATSDLSVRVGEMLDTENIGALKNVVTSLALTGSVLSLGQSQAPSVLVDLDALRTGAAGGDLSGNYPNPLVRPEAVADKVQSSSVVRNAVAAVFNDCSGSPLTPGTQLATCQAVSAQIEAARLVLGQAPATDNDAALPTPTVGRPSRAFLLAEPDAWAKYTISGTEYQIPLYLV